MEFLVLYRANLHDLDITMIRAVKASRSLIVIPRFLADLDVVGLKDVLGIQEGPLQAVIRNPN